MKLQAMVLALAGALAISHACAADVEGSTSGVWVNPVPGTATVTGVGGQTPDPNSWQVWKITPDGTASIFVQGPPLKQPNGIAFDQKGNVVS